MASAHQDGHFPRGGYRLHECFHFFIDDIGHGVATGIDFFFGAHGMTVDDGMDFGEIKISRHDHFVAHKPIGTLHVHKSINEGGPCRFRPGYAAIGRHPNTLRDSCQYISRAG